MSGSVPQQGIADSPLAGVGNGEPFAASRDGVEANEARKRHVHRAVDPGGWRYFGVGDRTAVVGVSREIVEESHHVVGPAVTRRSDGSGRVAPQIVPVFFGEIVERIPRVVSGSLRLLERR